MKPLIIFLLCCLSFQSRSIADPFLYTGLNASKTNAQPLLNEKNLTTAYPFFIENKGQIKDQDEKPRDDIQFRLAGEGLNLFIGKGELHYQFYKLQNDKKDNRKVEMYRMDVTLVGCNKEAVAIAEDVQEYYETYYLPRCLAGAKARTFGKITFKEVYPGIDWVWYIKNGRPEYDFIIKAGGDARNIRLAYNGATGLRINAGSLCVITPMGSIKELAPHCYDANGNSIKSAFHLTKNLLSFSVASYKGPLRIDPVLVWGTYYGADQVNCINVDSFQNIYVGGSAAATYTNVATAGSYQSVYGGGGSDAFCAKFSAAGQRMWATYYGGNDDDVAMYIACDAHNNIYLTGNTQSANNIASAGSHQPNYGGGQDAFLVKFNSAGQRIWATYYGGDTTDSGITLVCDAQNNIYMGGITTSSSNISTPGSYRELGGGSDGYIVKFDSNGIRQWGTYFSNGVLGISRDRNNYIYVCGQTPGSGDIPFGNSYQPAYGGGGGDAFLAKFSPQGQAVWGTYYGGSGVEYASGIVCHGNSVYIGGTTNSSTDIATPGSHQYTHYADYDAFLVKFDTAGNRQWGTYYGGNGEDINNYAGKDFPLAIDSIGNVYICGTTTSLDSIATAGSYQTTFGGQNDAFLAKFNNAGELLWGTYYGGSNYDGGFACVAGRHDNIYITGETVSPNNIATTGSFLPLYNNNNSFIARFNDCSTPFSPIITQVDAALSTSGYLTYQWYVNGVLITGATGQVYVPDSQGIYSVVVKDSNGCIGQSENFALFVSNITARAGIEIYPSPMHRTLNIAYDKMIKGIIVLLNTNGDIVLYEELQPSIDVSKLASGVYMYKILQNGTIVQRGKLLKD